MTPNQLHPDILTEMNQYLTVNDLKNFARSNQEMHKIYQTKRLQQLCQQKYQEEKESKLVNQILQQFNNGFKYVLVPNKHFINYINGAEDYVSLVTDYTMPDYIYETISLNEKGYPNWDSVLFNLFKDKVKISSDNDGLNRYMLYNSTLEQLKQVIQALVKLPNFDKNNLHLGN